MRPHYTYDPFSEPACCSLLDVNWFKADRRPEEVVECGDKAMDGMADHQHSVCPSPGQHLLYFSVLLRQPRLIVPAVEVTSIQVPVHEALETGGASLQWYTEDEILRQVLYVVQMAQWREDILVTLLFILTISRLTFGLAETVHFRLRLSFPVELCRKRVE